MQRLYHGEGQASGIEVNVLAQIGDAGRK
jgi:hypothetical protein